MKLYITTYLMIAAFAEPLESAQLPAAFGRKDDISSLLPPQQSGLRLAGAPVGGSGEPKRLSNSNKPIEIISYANRISEDGSYQFAYETENQIRHEEEGVLKNVGTESNVLAIHGKYTYTSPEGQSITLNYEADENGFRPSGDHLPTPPPLPEALLEAIRLHELASGRGIEQPPKPILFPHTSNVQGSYKY